MVIVVGIIVIVSVVVNSLQIVDAVNEIMYVPGLANVCCGFVDVELFPSPKFQMKFVEFKDVFIKFTVLLLIE